MPGPVILHRTETEAANVDVTADRKPRLVFVTGAFLSVRRYSNKYPGSQSQARGRLLPYERDELRQRFCGRDQRIDLLV